MKSKTTSKPQSDISCDLDPSEVNESYDEFNTVMIPTPRIMNKSPSNDEGIEPDSDLKSLHQVGGSWSLDSSSVNGDDDCCRRDCNPNNSVWQRRRSRAKVTRCCSSDSAVISDDDQNQNKGKYICVCIYICKLKKKLSLLCNVKVSWVNYLIRVRKKKYFL